METTSTSKIATIGATRVGRGTKFSDLVGIGHGCKIGEDCVFVGQTGLAGSVTVGDRVRLGGQTASNGHVTIGHDSVVWARGGIWSSLAPGGDYMGSPAIDSYAYKRQVVALQRLPDMHRQLQQLQAEVERLRSRLGEHGG